MIDPELLRILCCPETHQQVVLAEPSLVQALNGRIAAGLVRNRSGCPVQEQLEAGLIREDGRFLYPIWQGIPMLHIGEAIPIGGLTASSCRSGEMS